MEFTPLLIRIQELLLALSLGVQSFEFLLAGDGLGFTPPFSRFSAGSRRILRVLSSPTGFRVLNGIRGLGALACILLPGNLWVLGGLLALQWILPFRHRGAYNGGSDFMTAQVLGAVFLMRACHHQPMVVRAVFAYLGFQTVFSYFISGFIKARHPGWRNGRALQEFLRSNRYGTPRVVSELLQIPGVPRALSVTLLLFELSFPLVLTGPWLAWIFLVIGIVFHYLVYRVYGLNRFFWAWLSAYPAVYFLSCQRWIAP